jgi:membrane-bound lytic murein transglycosylase B
LVYRAVYQVAHGPVPAGYDIHHLCNQRDCVRLDHLQLVTHAENVRLGRVPKLSIEKAREIRARYAAGGTSHKRLGAEYGVAKQVITAILHNRLWRE